MRGEEGEKDRKGREHKGNGNIREGQNGREVQK